MRIFKIVTIIIASFFVANAANAKGCTVTTGTYAGKSGTYTQDTGVSGEPVGPPSCDFKDGKGNLVSVECGGTRCIDNSGAAKGKQNGLPTGVSGVKEQAPTGKQEKPITSSTGVSGVREQAPPVRPGSTIKPVTVNSLKQMEPRRAR